MKNTTCPQCKKTKIAEEKNFVEISGVTPTKTERLVCQCCGYKWEQKNPKAVVLED
jgi:hypothetical protein